MRTCLPLTVFLLSVLPPALAAEPAVTVDDYARAYALRQELRNTVFRASVDPQWIGDSSRFWYRNDLPRARREFILVDAERGTRKPAFDHQRLAEQLSKARGKQYPPDRLPIERLKFADGRVSFQIERERWQCDLKSYEVTKAANSDGDPSPRNRDRRRRTSRRRGNSGQSPDGKYRVFVRNHNLFLRANEDGQEWPLTSDGKEGRTYGVSSWSPDSKTVVAHRITPGETNTVYLLESSKRDTFKSQLRSRNYAQPGTRFASYELRLFDAATRAQKQPGVDPVNFRGPPRPRWKPDGGSFTYQQLDRGYQRFRIVEVDVHTGAARNIVDEKTDTFIDSTRIYVHHLDETGELIFASERDGWRHLYLIDAASGQVKQQITTGKWVVRDVVHVDAEHRRLWFSASGRHPNEDPYHVHHYRVNFDGSELVALTGSNGTHTVKYSPDRRYLVTTWSRADHAPVSELRDGLSGNLVTMLEEADTSRLQATGYPLPEVFAAKGRDDTTDIYGLVFCPRKLDPDRKYPVIENIYAGPHSAHVRKSFRTYDAMQALAELGFIVVQIDGMGTAHRGKKFHDVCWQNLGDGGFPDRIRWIKALGKKYPYVDASRVGIYGTSAGGYDSTRAMLAHPDFYDVAVSSCGNHDHRIDKQWWNEQWMGYPVDKHYHEQSNITNAGKLRGRLLLIVGELDTNVPPESTLRLADALIKAGKQFELLMVPGMGHSSGGEYGNRRRWDFFVRHLHGVPPPDWNTVDWQRVKSQRSTRKVAAVEDDPA